MARLIIWRPKRSREPTRKPALAINKRKQATRRRKTATCMSCEATSDRSKFRTGPDGSQTLCGQCSWSYRQLRLQVFSDTDGNISAKWTSGARPVMLLGFHKDRGLQDMNRPKTSSLTPGRVPSQRQGLCLRCKLASSPGCRSGPDGARTLCEACFEIYKKCELTLFQQNCGMISVVPTPGAKTVGVDGFRSTTPREHYLHPLVYPLQTEDELIEDEDCGDCHGSKNVANQSEQDTDEDFSVGNNGNNCHSIEKQNSTAMEAMTDVLAPCTIRVKCTQIDEDNSKEMARRGTEESSSGTRDFANSTHSSTTPASTGAKNNLVLMTASLIKNCSKSLARRFSVRMDVRYRAFRQVIKDTFSVRRIGRVTYTDDDGDIVPITSDNELGKLLSFVCGRGISPVRVEVGME